MKTLFLLSCVIVAALSFPQFKRKSSAPIAAQTIRRTAEEIHKRGIMKRQYGGGFGGDPVQMAFDWIDTNSDGEITADEFATFYSNAGIPGLDLTKQQWITAFNQAMPSVDTNGNNLLEINEFRTLARIGGFSGK